jgi:hypothetical protein
MLKDSGIADAPEIERRPELPVSELPHREAPDRWTFAEVALLASAYAPDQRLLCLIIDTSHEDEELLEVAPLTTETFNASDLDVIVGSSEGPLGYDVMVELWNHGTVLRSQVMERFGILAELARDEVSARYAAMYGAPAPVSEADGDVRLGTDGDAGVETVIARQWVGPPIAAPTDPRAVFQETEAARTRPFWGPAADVLSDENEPPMSGWSRVMTLAVGNWSEDEFPVDTIADELASTDASVEELEAALASRLSALVAGGVAQVAPVRMPTTSSWVDNDQLPLAAGLDPRQAAWIKLVVTSVVDRVRNLRHDATTDDG